MTRADLTLLVVTLVSLPLLYSYYWGERDRGATAVVSVARAQPTEIDLGENQRITFAGARGTSTLEIRAGAVRFAASPCRNKHCIHAGWLTTSGDFAACVPNQISVLITGSTRRFDAINF